jgi:hypothetical protein
MGADYKGKSFGDKVSQKNIQVSKQKDGHLVKHLYTVYMHA